MSLEERSRQSLVQIELRQSDLCRWNDGRNFDPRWNSRARFVAALIYPPAQVIDLGCGPMALEKELRAGITYIPADLTARDERTHVFDANTGDLPDADADVAVALGLLEYVHEPAQLMKKAVKKWGRLIVSYHPSDVPGASTNRLAKGWLNDLDSNEFTDIAQGAGFDICRAYSHMTTDRIYDLRRSV